jgi:hypothetical protein
MIVGSRTTFTTTDSPEVVRAWYETTLHAMGWDDVDNMTSDQTMILFQTANVCPIADARIAWEIPVNGITTVEVDYSTAACRR